MNRQQKRAQLKSLAKDIVKMQKGRISVAEMKVMKIKIKQLQAAGVLPKKKHIFKTFIYNIRYFFNKLQRILK